MDSTLQRNTLYLHNLNEKIKIDALKETLYNLGSLYGEILDVIAHRNIRMRGQAFLVFRDPMDAARCMDDVQGLPLYGKTIDVEYAKSRSDAIAAVEGQLDEQRSSRLHRKKTAPKMEIPRPSKRQKTRMSSGAAAAAGSTTFMGAPSGHAIPDEFLPPNAILFLQQLPPNTTEADLRAVFHPYQGFLEIRMVPVRPDIAFVEFESEVQAAFVKERVQHVEIHGKPFKTTFARK